MSSLILSITRKITFPGAQGGAGADGNGGKNPGPRN